MVELIPGVGSNMAQAADIGSKLITGFSYLILGVVAAAVVYGVMWILYNKVLRFNIPVTLRYEVGGAVTWKKDKIWIKRSGEKWDVKFQKGTKLIAQIPPDSCGYFVKNKKVFDGFVRDNQVTWLYPTPQTKVLYPAFSYFNDKGEQIEVPAQEIETFQTIPTNMTESYIHQLSKNEKLLTKKKWYQDPAILQIISWVVIIISVIFFYLICRDIPGLVNGYLEFAKTVAANCQAVQIK